MTDIETLRQWLTYDSETGLIVWTKNRGNVVAGNEFGTLMHTKSNTYKRAHIFGHSILAHRVAFCLHFGRWPSGDIDHINHIGTDNRICNLREVSRRVNCKNRKMDHDNKSGFTGVSWHAKSKKWMARIRCDGRQVFIGYFKNKEEAAKAWRMKAAELGFHNFHGEKNVEHTVNP
jgi:hypothetical protein